jgi:hypothetical protein
MVPTHESSAKFVCDCCNYNTSRKSQYERHLATDKHRILQNPTSIKFQTENIYMCNCGKSYKHSSSLYAHKKDCNISAEIIEDDNISCLADKDLIMMLIKQNTELMEIVKNGTHNTNNSNNTNNTNNSNNAFNLNFFLNETCKNAMNITDFVDSIKVQLTDLEKMGEVGYIEGLSNIISSNLKILDVTERPVHCTDKKRETMYVKDQDKWEKEDDNKTKLRKAIKKIADKNFRLLPQYREKYKGCQYSDSNYSDKYNKIMIEALGGAGDNDAEKEDKIIKNISRITAINNKKATL